MIYTKLKIELLGHEKTFNRIIYINNKIDLTRVGITIMKSFGSRLDHLFLFRDATNDYILPIMGRLKPGEKYMYVFTIKDFHLLDGYFDLVYDLPGEYVFRCHVLEEDVELASYCDGFVISGEGQRIFEGHRDIFEEYIKGNVNELDSIFKEIFIDDYLPNFIFDPLEIETINALIANNERETEGFYGIDEIYKDED